jgi:hypothetical protein
MRAWVRSLSLSRSCSQPETPTSEQDWFGSRPVAVRYGSAHCGDGDGNGLEVAARFPMTDGRAMTRDASNPPLHA